MKKSLLAIAIAAAVPAVASAQVVISGSIHAGLQDSGQAGQKLTGVSLGGGANAINITATEVIDKKSNLSAGARFQMRFNSVTGDANSASGRGDWGTSLLHDANVFVSGNFGTFRIGKIYEDSNCAFDPWGCLTTGGGGMASGAGGMTGMLVAANTIHNSVYYVTPSVGGLTLSYHSSIGGVKGYSAPSSTTSNGFRDNERQIINATYAAGPLMAQALFVRGGSAASNAAMSDASTKDQSLAVSYDFKVAKVMLSRVDSEDAAGTKTKKINTIGGVVPISGSVQLLGGWSQNDAAAKTQDTRWAIGANYLLSKRTTLGVDIFEAEAANSSTGFTLRARHTF